MVIITDKRQTQHFGELKAGETFLYKSCYGDDLLYIKLYEGDSGAVCLESGIIVVFQYNDNVTIVDVEINIIK